MSHGASGQSRPAVSDPEGALLIEPSPRVMRRFARVCDLHARWFRYRCIGTENIPRGRSALLVGYHGRPAYDMFILQANLWRRGRPVYGIGHKLLFRHPRTWAAAGAVGLYDGSDELTRQIIERGDLIGVLPGGTRECFRPSTTQYEVDWGSHRGYLRFAARHGLPVVPVAASGADEYLRIYGRGVEASKRYFGTDAVPCGVGFGFGGLPFPFCLPRRVTVRQLVGPAIDLGADADPGDPDWLEAAHLRVTGAVQELLNRAVKGRCPPAQWRDE